MKPKEVEKGTLTPEQRERLRLLLRALYIESLRGDVEEDDPAFIELLEAWEDCKVPSSARPVVPAYRSHGGSWLTGGVSAVTAAIAEHVGDE